MLSKNRIKYIQSLSHKKYRDAHRSFIAETPKVINEFLISNYKIKSIAAVDEWINTNRDKINKEIELIGVSPKELQRISLLKTPQSALAIIEMQEENLPTDLHNRWILGMDNLQDPGNFGTIIRIADWFGIGHIFCSQGTVSPYNPKVVQASMGSLARVTVHEVDLENFIGNYQLPVIAATLDGASIYNMEKELKSGLIIIGNEGNGISESILNQSTHRLTIPRVGSAESLNAAISTGIIVSHLVMNSGVTNQRTSHP